MPEAARQKYAVPFSVFSEVVSDLERNCSNVGCIYSRTTCCVRVFRDKIMAWIETNMNDSQRLNLAMALLCDNAIRVENHFYWGFFADRHVSRRVKGLFAEFNKQFALALRGKKDEGNSYAEWKDDR